MNVDTIVTLFAMKFVPSFEQFDSAQSLLNFEKAMAIHKFPKEKWSALLHTKLTGKACKVFSELSIEQCQKYDVLKAALLTAYNRIPEFYSKRFRSLSKGHLEIFSSFAFHLSLPFTRWSEGVDAFTEVDNLKEILKIEQFTTSLPVIINGFLNAIMFH